MDNSTAENYAEQAAFFAHEIKNPLAVIKANVQLIELENKSENTKSFETVYACIEKINNLIQENMEYIKNAEKASREADSDVAAIVRKIINKYSSSCDRTFKFESKVKDAAVNCKSELLESLFENLIKNAVEATEKGDTITAEIKIRQKRVAVVIADSGCGISDKDIARIGELFYTTKKGGSGVGLFMCKRIVEQNGGKFKVAHNKPKGTKVTVELNLK